MFLGTFSYLPWGSLSALLGPSSMFLGAFFHVSWDPLLLALGPFVSILGTFLHVSWDLAKDCEGLRSTAKVCAGLRKIEKDCAGLRRIAKDCAELRRIARDSEKVAVTTSCVLPLETRASEALRCVDRHCSPKRPATISIVVVVTDGLLRNNAQETCVFSAAK